MNVNSPNFINLLIVLPCWGNWPWVLNQNLDKILEISAFTSPFFKKSVFWRCFLLACWNVAIQRTLQIFVLTVVSSWQFLLNAIKYWARLISLINKCLSFFLYPYKLLGFKSSGNLKHCRFGAVEGIEGM